MSLDANTLLLSLLFSGVGFVCFVYGKKQQRAPQMVGGVLLMVFPYFVGNPWVMAAVGLGIVGLLWLSIRMGL